MEYFVYRLSCGARKGVATVLWYVELYVRDRREGG